VKRWLPLAGIALLAVLAGFSLLLAERSRGVPEAAPGTIDITPAAIFSARFADPEGREQSLAPLAGRIMVINFWATWCTPCREEMPGFVRLQSRWKERGVRFVGIANDEALKVAAFGRELGINYPLWVGGTEVMDLSRRLGNRLGILPHTAILDAQGRVLESRIGAYSESALDSRLSEIVPKSP
jgi:thiol-disulfide isomerase/thioredoxin